MLLSLTSQQQPLIKMNQMLKVFLLKKVKALILIQNMVKKYYRVSLIV
ncbi:hypothetical protein GLYMA_14G020501v4 [Glycine max]|nr:hypothetical protein GLYMA_14G020501v4 [Glycine max]KAH1092733.1 hypothetical protein GYH30_038778 [Glycine max]